jgi:hypothetical protein
VELATCRYGVVLIGHTVELATCRYGVVLIGHNVELATCLVEACAVNHNRTASVIKLELSPVQSLTRNSFISKGKKAIAELHFHYQLFIMQSTGNEVGGITGISRPL